MNRINSKKPKENSRPAKPNIKKVFDITLMSSFVADIKIEKQYKVNHVISE